MLDGVWPNTPLITDLFPESLLEGVADDACVPVVFGEESYIPLQSIADSGNVYYIMGIASGNTYSTPSRMTSPHAIDNQVEYTSGVTYTQSTVGTVRCFRPQIDSEYRFWRSGGQRVSPIVKYTETGDTL